jgi:hypothetical protein
LLNNTEAECAAIWRHETTVPKGDSGTRLPQVVDFEAMLLLIRVTAHFEVTQLPRPLGNEWAIGRLRRATPAPAGALSVAFRTAQPRECKAITDIPASARPGAPHPGPVAEEAVEDPVAVVAAVEGIDRSSYGKSESK